MLSGFCIENLTFTEVLPYCFLPFHISKVKAKVKKASQHYQVERSWVVPDI